MPMHVVSSVSFDSFEIRKQGQQRSLAIFVDDILKFEIEGQLLKLDRVVLRSRNRLEVKASTATVPPAMLQSLSDLLSGSVAPLPAKRFAVVINQRGGRGNALAVYKRKVQPLLARYGVGYVEAATSSVADVRTFLSECDFSGFDSLVCVGGDGSVNLLMLTLLQRFGAALPASLQLAVIPCGTTNAIAHSAYGTDDVTSAALHLLLGRPVGLDVCEVRAEDDSLAGCALTAVSYGFLGDLLESSEHMRLFGTSRYALAGMRKMCENAAYSGLVTCWPTGGAAGDSPCRPLWCDQCIAGSSSSSCKVATKEEQCAPVEVQGVFHHVGGAICSCRCAFTPQGLSPIAHLGDGCMTVLVVRSRTMWSNAKFVLRVLSGHNHLCSEKCQWWKASKFSFVPEPDKPLGVWNIDGEQLHQPSKKLTFEVKEKLVSILIWRPKTIAKF